MEPDGRRPNRRHYYDLIILVMQQQGADKFPPSRFTLGAEVSMAAGRVGRTATAQKDAQMRAEILCQSRITGIVCRPRAGLYGKELESRKIVTNAMRMPKSAARLRRPGAAETVRNTPH